MSAFLFCLALVPRWTTQHRTALDHYGLPHLPTPLDRSRQPPASCSFRLALSAALNTSRVPLLPLRSPARPRPLSIPNEVSVHYTEPTATMYITSDLFSAGCNHDTPNASAPHTWNTMVDQQQPTGLGKRKRRLDLDEGQGTRHTGTQDTIHNNTCFNPTNYSIIHGNFSDPPVTTGGSVRFVDTTPSLNTNSRIYRRTPASSTTTATTTYLNSALQPKPLKRLPTKRLCLSKHPSHLMDIEPVLISSPLTSHHQQQQSTTPQDLRPCYICHKAPKRKSDKDSYLDCVSCHGRACYVCARNCASCQTALCSKCCVEVGEEGDTWCLGCFERGA